MPIEIGIKDYILLFFDLLNGYFERVMKHGQSEVRRIAAESLGSLGKRVGLGRIALVLVNALQDSDAYHSRHNEDRMTDQFGKSDDLTQDGHERGHRSGRWQG